LLGKIRQNQPLSRPEVEELKRYEMTRAQTKKPVPQAGVSVPGRRKRVSLAEVTALGLNSDSLTEAAAEFSGPGDLQALIAKRPKVKAAWERGRMLQTVRIQAATTATVSQAAKELNMTGLELRAVLDTDREVADLWHQERRRLRAALNEAMVALARAGKANAIRYVENFLREERAAAGFDYEHVPIAVMVDITGRTRQTLHTWYREGGLPRNPDCTFNLADFLRWFEASVASRTKTEPPPVDEMRQIKIKRQQAEFHLFQGKLLERSAVENGMVTRMQTFLAAIENLLPAAAAACAQAQGDIEQIEEQLRSFCQRLRRHLCELPSELCLPKETADAFRDILGRMEPPEPSADETGES